MSDFGLVGPSYTPSSRYQDSQQLINWYLEKDPTKQPGERGMYALYPTPGYTTKVIPQVGEVRGMRAVQGLLYAIVGNALFSIDTNFVATNLGALGTANGPISITDNGAALYFCDGVQRYTYTISTQIFLIVNDGGFTTGFGADEVDNFIIYSQPGSKNWGATSLNSIVSPALSVGQKDGAADNLVRAFVSNRQVYLLGEKTGEVWIDTGGFPFPFARIPGSSMQHGLAAKNSVARLGNSFAYVSQDDRGQGIIVVMNNYSPEEISNHSITNTLINVDISDAVGFSFQMGGHEFYVVSFPATDTTWMYDAATQEWNKWLSVDSEDLFHRHPAQCSAVFNGQVLIGDYQSGAISVLSNLVYTDNGNTIRRLRRCPHLVNDYKQTFYESLQIRFEPGVGLSGTGSGIGSNPIYDETGLIITTETGLTILTEFSAAQGVVPQCMLRWSNDGGSNWRNEHWRNIGAIGRYDTRTYWRKLGNARDRVFELVITDPVKAVIISAELVAEAGDN